MESLQILLDCIEMPETLVSDLKISVVFKDGSTKTAAEIKDNHQRLVRFTFGEVLTDVVEVSIIPEKTTGAQAKYRDCAHIFSVDIL